MTNPCPDKAVPDAELWSDFLALCDFGGRLTGSPGEVAARDWAFQRLSAISMATRQSTPYDGWECRSVRAELPDGTELEVQPLLCSGATPPDGLVLKVVDCGRGTAAEIIAAGVEGKAALVRHEYMFANDTIHRRVKLNAAIAAGAAAFLIAAPEPGLGAVSGSAGLTGAPRIIPALGLSFEAAEAIGSAGCPVRLLVDSAWQQNRSTETLVLDLPGAGPDRVVLSAHIDGHAGGESALDNATGVALGLALARFAAPYIPTLPRGLTVCLFSAEEWALTGSRRWLEQMPPARRDRLVFNLNLDTVAGGTNLTALTSGFPPLSDFVAEAAGLSTHLPLMANSDHANFAAAGIPALRLVSGFGERNSPTRLLLTRQDRRDLVTPKDFKAPMQAAWAILRAALTAPADRMASLRSR